MGGSNEKSNLVELTIEEHALAHKQLYEIYGKNEDYIAWKMLEGKDAECESQRIILAKEGFKKFMLSQDFENFKRKISNSLKGKKQSIESNLKRSISLKKAHQEKRHPNPFSKKDKEYFRQLYEKTNGAERLANGRKKSKKWKDSVTSEEYKLKKCLSNPRSKQIEYGGILYPSIRNAAKSLNISYSKMRSLLNKK